MTKKQLKSTSKRCDGCGSNLVFAPETQSLKCLGCGKNVEIKKNPKIQKHSYNAENIVASKTSWITDERVFKCENCGGEIGLTNMEFAKSCPYCGSSNVSDIGEFAGIKPDGIIPFAVSESDARKKFAEQVKKKCFLPSAFKKNIPTCDTHPMYFPSFMFDMDTDSSYTGTLVETYTTTDSEGRQVTKERTFHISGSEKVSFTNLAVESSSHLNNDELSGILPYDMSGAYVYDSDYVRGYSVEHYNDDLQKCMTVAKEKADSRIRSRILAQYHYSRVAWLSVDTDYSNMKYCYTMLPVYNFAFNYKEKNYNVLMNGQTGKVGKGLPLSKWKIALTVIFFILLGVGLFVVPILLAK